MFCCCATLVSALVSEGDDPKSPLCTSALAALVAIEGRLGALSDRNSCMGSLHASLARGIRNIEYNLCVKVCACSSVWEHSILYVHSLAVHSFCASHAWTVGGCVYMPKTFVIVHDSIG